MFRNRNSIIADANLPFMYTVTVIAECVLKFDIIVFLYTEILK